MEHEDSIPHSERDSNIPFPESSQPNSAQFI